ncbi:probable WRKY transcription factor 56 [Punica granatum]|uniref:WRKY domain-containing protein n=2 Tax=Punica granatum TaxID=22663 RepID=A0A218XXQ5_PUNGR|nr:probable WRKY transcription factor 56 [Punica granatum]OWM89783.1 hypothetical protein CDL15_Pgr024531 [Punica granatum]PKI54220.1 hypothetical protein CRG98_025374 [Punica granatum]
METYPPMFLSSSSSPPFMAMNMINSHHHHQATNKVVDDELAGGGFLGLMPSMEAQGALSSSNNTSSAEGASTGHNDFRDKGLAFEAGSEVGEPKAAGRRKGDHHQGYGKAASKGKVRKPRYAFQTRSHVDILDDGYRWRKYGQKAVKNNKFPRSYYRCTFQGCNVKKQVQRLTKDEGVVVTTYEGSHSHPIEKSTDNFEHILSQFQIYTSI